MTGFIKSVFPGSKSCAPAFFLFALFLLAANAVQCAYRSYAREVFTVLLSLQKQNVKSDRLDALWKSSLNSSRTAEIALYAACAVFFIWVARQIILERITVRKVLLYTGVVYLAAACVFVPLQLVNSGIGNISLPVFASLGLSLFLIADAWLTKKIHRRLRP